MTRRRPNLDVVIKDSPRDAADEVASIIASSVIQKPACVLGLATGATPIAVYQSLVAMHNAGKVSFSKTVSFNLDEYQGLSENHPQSFRHFMNQQLYEATDFDPVNTHFPTSDPVSPPVDYERKIKESGGIDLQLLGIGSNGHIAFNEPGSQRDSRTRWVELTEETIQANARFFASQEEVPRRAITMGIGTILEAKQIVLLATGTHKAVAISRTLNERPTSACPASFLQDHKRVTIILDQEAASRL